MTTTYDISSFVSPCCNAFNHFENDMIFCSKCGQSVKKIEEHESMTVSVKFNNKIENNVSGDIVNIFKSTAQRFAHDPTCEIIKNKCPKCGNPESRYMRDPLGNLIFVCIKCRHVFSY